MEQSGITYICTDKQNLYKRLTSKLFTNSIMSLHSKLNELYYGMN